MDGKYCDSNCSSIVWHGLDILVRYNLQFNDSLALVINKKLFFIY